MTYARVDCWPSSPAAAAIRRSTSAIHAAYFWLQLMIGGNVLALAWALIICLYEMTRRCLSWVNRYRCFAAEPDAKSALGPTRTALR